MNVNNLIKRRKPKYIDKSLIRLLYSTKVLKFFGQIEANKMERELFYDYRYSLDQLVELAGLSCATAIAKTYPKEQFVDKAILVCCGPGNNGGDGLVCARHLKLFGYHPVVYYPKRAGKKLYQDLTRQVVSMDIPIVDCVPEKLLETKLGLIVDAIFGINFKPPTRDTFVPLLNVLKTSHIPIASIDVPSGWDVDHGEPEEGGLKPELLISLTAPKRCAEKFQGKYHFLGGRFVPPRLVAKYNLNIPTYPGTDCCVLLP